MGANGTLPTVVDIYSTRLPDPDDSNSGKCSTKLLFERVDVAPEDDSKISESSGLTAESRDEHHEGCMIFCI